MSTSECLIKTPIGIMKGIATEEALVSLLFEHALDAPIDNEKNGVVDFNGQAPDSHIFKLLKAQLTEYFNNAGTVFKIPLSPAGTDFQLKVWQSLLTIPAGEKRTYLEQTNSFTNADSIRAVARANGANPIVILIPCHRVVGSKGKLTGYSGGLWRKQFLLNHESAQISYHIKGKQNALPF